MNMTCNGLSAYAVMCDSPCPVETQLVCIEPSGHLRMTPVFNPVVSLILKCMACLHAREFRYVQESGGIGCVMIMMV